MHHAVRRMMLGVVLSPIDLDNQAFSQAHKIDNIIPERLLPAEFIPAKLTES